MFCHALLRVRFLLLSGDAVDNRLFAPIPTPKYNEFLFAPICEKSNGMRLSVLSALARMNVDPWEEATRLAEMPNTIAEGALVSTLDLIPNKSWEPSEIKVIAARLIRLLPQRNEASTTAAKDIAAVRAKRTSYFLLCVAIAISILSSHHQAPTTNAVDSTTKSVATSADENVPQTPCLLARAINLIRVDVWPSTPAQADQRAARSR